MSKFSSERSENIGDLKKKALNFYSTNVDIIRKVEDSLNELFFESPQDVYGYLAEYFNKYARVSTISKIEASRQRFYDPKGQPTFRIGAFCIQKNVENCIIIQDVACYAPGDVIHDSSRIQQIQEDDVRRVVELDDIIEFINKEITPVLKYMAPHNQGEIDATLNKLFEEKQKEYVESYIRITNASVDSIHESSQIDNSKKPPSPKSQKNNKNPKSSMSNIAQIDTPTLPKTNPNLKALHTLSALSKLVFQCSISLSQKQPFMHIYELKSNSNENEKRFKIPKPLVTILQNGKGFSGKQSLIKEFILFPKSNVSVKESIELINKVNLTIRDTLYQSKSFPGAANKNVTDIGSFTCALDTPQQGLDMLETAIQISCGDKASKLSIGLNFGANELFDSIDASDKTKYEVATGSIKTVDELIEIYADLVNKYPRIALLIEPFTKKDILAWYRLHSKVGKTCLVANTFSSNDVCLPINALLHKSKLSTPEVQKITSESTPIQVNESQLFMPVNFYKYENTFTISTFIASLKKSTDNTLLNGILCSLNETEDTFLTDLAVGTEVEYFKIGGFSRSERINKINRLLDIETYLEKANMLSTTEVDFQTKLSSINLEIPTEHVLAIQQIEEQQPIGKKASKK